MSGGHQGQAVLRLSGLGAAGPGGDEPQGWRGGRGDPEAPGLSQGKPGAGEVWLAPPEGVPHWEWGDRISQQVHQPCATEALWCLVVRGAGQRDAGIAMCQVQWDLPEGLW